MTTIDCDADDGCSCSCASECSCSCFLMFSTVRRTCPEVAVCVSGNAADVYLTHKSRYIALVGCIPPKAGARNRTNGGACSRPSATRGGRALPKRAQPMRACACRTALVMAILRHASCFLSNSNFCFSVFKSGTAGLPAGNGMPSYTLSQDCRNCNKA